MSKKLKIIALCKIQFFFPVKAIVSFVHSFTHSFVYSYFPSFFEKFDTCKIETIW